MVIDGKKIAAEISAQLSNEVSLLNQRGIQPKLVIIGIGADERSQVYIRMKLQKAKEIGIIAEYVDLTQNTNEQQCAHIEQLNNDTLVHGIIIQLPVSGWYDPQDLIDCIDPRKDVDGLTTQNQLALENNEKGFVGGTPLGVMKILESIQYKVSGKTVCVVGRSNLVGKPVSLLLQHSGANVLVGHRQITDLGKLTAQADVIVSAAGSPKLIQADMIKNGAVVIDVGINEDAGKLRGDVDFDSVKDKASYITPVPGGVGPLTVVMLLSNVLKAAKK